MGANTSSQPQFDLRVVQRVASRYTDSAIPTHARISGIAFLRKIISFLGFETSFVKTARMTCIERTAVEIKTPNFSNRVRKPKNGKRTLR